MKNKRPAIGLILNNVKSNWNISLIQGVMDAARISGVKIIVYCIGILKKKRNFVEQENIICSLVNTEKIQGLIILNDSNEFCTKEDYQAIYRQYADVPLIILNNEEMGFYNLQFDVYQTVSKAIIHLIEVHKLSKISLFMNSYRNDFSLACQALNDVFARFHIPVTPETIITNIPDVSKNSELLCMLNQLLDKGVEAIVTNDRPAVRILNLLVKSGVVIPDDIALMGLNSIRFSQFSIPPLTTVDRSFYKLGYTACENILALINGKTIEKIQKLPVELVIRQSCGCNHYKEPGLQVPDPAYHFTSLDNNCEKLLNKLAEILGQTPEIIAVLKNLINDYLLEAENPGKGVFIQTLNDVLHKRNFAHTDSNNWHNAISILIKETVAYIKNTESLFALQNIWQQARVLITEKYQVFHLNKYYDQKSVYKKLRNFGGTSSSGLSLTEVLNKIATEIPKMNFSYIYIVLYENSKPYHYPGPGPEWSRLVLAYTPDGCSYFQDKNIRFQTKDLLPAEFMDRIMQSDDDRFSFLVQALKFELNQIGYVILSIDEELATTAHWLRHSISSLLQGSLLLEKMEKQQQDITGLYGKLKKENLRMINELDATRFLQKMVQPHTKELSTLKHYQLAASFLTATHMGRDYYDILETDQFLYISIGNITGLGLESGMIVVMLQTAIRTLIESGENDLQKIYRTTSNIIFSNIENINNNVNMSLMLAALEIPGKNKLDNGIAHSSGYNVRLIGNHVNPVVVKNNGFVEKIDNLYKLNQADIRNPDTFQIQRISLGDNDNLVFFTDSMTESVNKDNKKYGDNRLFNIFSNNCRKNAEDIKQAVMQDFDRFLNQQELKNNISVIVLKAAG